MSETGEVALLSSATTRSCERPSSAHELTASSRSPQRRRPSFHAGPSGRIDLITTERDAGQPTGSPSFHSPPPITAMPRLPVRASRSSSTILGS